DRRRPERLAELALPCDVPGAGVERVHARLLHRRVAGVAEAVRLAEAFEAAEVAEGGCAVDPLAVERGRPDEAAGEPAEHDVGLPAQRPARPVARAVRAVLRA